MKFAFLTATSMMILASVSHAAITNNSNGTFTDSSTGLV
jgi:hypothetical protein